MDEKILREKVLSDCPPDKSFWTCLGTVIRNLYELANSIEAMNDSAFLYHVNEDNQKNDFAKWVAEVLDDAELSQRLEQVTDKQEYLETIRNRITELENIQ